ncbi:MAG: hypothetical protein JWP85_2120 [Rhodoglobus sp.]|nr:hypothetical protein [Rhodoglobus sp.]
MPAKGRPWTRETALFKEECRKRNAPCWNCQLGGIPIDYLSKYDPDNYQPARYTTDHKNPTSLGGDKMQRSNWAPAHAHCNSSRGNGTRRAELPTSRKW